MKIIPFVVFLFSSIFAFGQREEIVTILFRDKSNFDIAKAYQQPKPKVFYVLNRTEEWRPDRFYIDADLSLDSVRKELENDEHSPYNHSYIYKDSSIDRLFSKLEKENMYRQALEIKERKISARPDLFKIAGPFKNRPNGFMFSFTDPILTSDKKYAIIELSVYNKDDDTENLNHSYFGNALLIYQNIKGKGWKKIRKLELIIN